MVSVNGATGAKPTTPASPEPLTVTATAVSSERASPSRVAVTVTSLAPDPSESSECDSDSTTSGASISVPYCAAAGLMLLLASCAAPAARSTVTSPEAAGVIVATYSAYPPVRSPRDVSTARSPDAVPLPTVMSASSNPNTGSSNAIRTANGPCTGPPSAGPVIVTRGERRSMNAVQLPALLTCPSASSATPNGTVIVRSPSNSSATSTVAWYSSPDPFRAVAVPFSTTRSDSSKPVTDPEFPSCPKKSMYTDEPPQLDIPTFGPSESSSIKFRITSLMLLKGSARSSSGPMIKPDAKTSPSLTYTPSLGSVSSFSTKSSCTGVNVKTPVPVVAPAGRVTLNLNVACEWLNG